MAQREDELADKFNEVFQLNLDWGDDHRDEISRKDIIEFAKLTEQILPKLRLREVQNAIWTLTQNKYLVRLALQDEGFMHSLKLSKEERDAIERGLRNPEKLVFVERSLPGGEVLTKSDARILMAMFFPRERELLQEAGLNQSSIAVILSKLQQAERYIEKNLLEQRSVLTGRYVNAADVLHRSVDRLRSAVSESTSKIRKSTASFASSTTLTRSKEKIIGLATLWGNAVPLLTSKDWGIASVISATAGATVAAVLPSGQKANNSVKKKASQPGRSPK